ncbi:hypothetical protein AB0G32_19745 [Streptomyces sp. NPDC023723]|uniref:hypothetical protein n=1 Tax=Streptomyces sp. NPDC023723 TaxID=3154323 RepID=UPI0033CD521F
MNDEELKSQAVQDPGQTERLIAIEGARARDKRKHTAILCAFAFAALIVLTGAALFVINAAGDLKLPWSRIGTALGTFLLTPVFGGLGFWVKRKLSARRHGGTSPQNPPESRTEGDQNQVGTS